MTSALARSKDGPATVHTLSTCQLAPEAALSLFDRAAGVPRPLIDCKIPGLRTQRINVDVSEDKPPVCFRLHFRNSRVQSHLIDIK